MFTPDLTQGNWFGEHARAYLADGAAAHMVDLTAGGGNGPTPSLLLRTVGRKSGNTLYSPLIYGEMGDEKVLIASKGGSRRNPAWFHNLTAAAEVEFKLKDDCWRAVTRIVEGGERERMWRMMAEIYPPFDDYQAKTERHIPVIALKPIAQIPKLSN